MPRGEAKARGASISIGTLNEYKRVLRDMEGIVIKHAWRPLRSWPATRYPEQDRIEAFLSIPSRETK